MCELAWGEPGTFLKKRRVRRKHPLYPAGPTQKLNPHQISVCHDHVLVARSKITERAHTNSSQASSYEYPLPQPCCSQSKSRCSLEPAPGASCRTWPWPPPRLLTSRSNAPARLVCPPWGFTTRQFDPSVPMAPCATRLLLTPSAHVIHMRRHSLVSPPAPSARL